MDGEELLKVVVEVAGHVRAAEAEIAGVCGAVFEEDLPWPAPSLIRAARLLEELERDVRSDLLTSPAAVPGKPAKETERSAARC